MGVSCIEDYNADVEKVLTLYVGSVKRNRAMIKDLAKGY